MKAGPLFRENVDEALRFAAEAHDGQMRKTDPSVPYIQHPMAVGLMLERAGFPADVVIAGILHDVVEDTDFTLAAIRKKFGRRVAELVHAVSEDKSKTWEQRKHAGIEMIRRAPPSVLAIKAADKLHNTQSILHSLKRGRNVWKAFKRDKKTTIAHYESFAEAMARRWHHPLAKELLRAVRALRKQA